MKKWVFIFIVCTVCVGVYISPLFQKEIDVKIVGKDELVKGKHRWERDYEGTNL